MEVIEYTTPEILEHLINCIEPGAALYIANVPNEIYHATKGVSSTGAKTAAQSEQRYWRYITAPPETRKEHYVFGELAHESIRFTPEQILGRYCDSVPFVSGQRNLGKAQRAMVNDGLDPQQAIAQFNLKPAERQELHAFNDEVAGRQVVTSTQIAEARQIAELIHSHPIVSAMLANQTHYFELSVWRRDEDGFLRKARPDVFFPQHGVLFDWKTIRDLIWTYDTGGDRQAFVKWNLDREVAKRDYAFSGAWYLSVLDHMENGAFMLFFCDKDALEIYPPWVPCPERIAEEWRRCEAAIRAIKQVSRKTSNGEVVEALLPFLPVDDHVFQGQVREFN